MPEAREITPAIRQRLNIRRGPRGYVWFLSVPRGRSWAFLYSTESVTLDGRKRFLSVLYRLEGVFVDGRRFANLEAVPAKYGRRIDKPNGRRIEIEERWERVRQVAFAVRWKAKDRAWKWRCEKAGEPFHSLHVPPRRSAAQKATAANLRKAD